MPRPALAPARPGLFAAVLLLLAGVPGTAAQTMYLIDTRASRVLVHVGKTGWFSFAGHTHEVEAPIAEGRITVDPSDLARSKVRVAFDTAALRVTGKGEPADDVPEVQRTMESAEVLHVQRYPRMTFVSRDIRVLDESADEVRVRVTGDLTLHGVTRRVETEVRARTTENCVSATGTLTIKQTDFGIQPVTAGAGTVRVKDELRIEFTLVATQAQQQRPGY